MPVGANNHAAYDEESVSDAIYRYTDADSSIRSLERDSIEQLQFELDEIGGIEECTFSLSPGVTVLVGENATNRTSTLRGIGAAIGAETGTIRANATDAAARVDVITPDRTETFSRDYKIVDDDTARTTFSAGGLQKSGVDALTDFAVLLEDNRLRRAVRRDGDLYDVLMAPVDTDAIYRQIKKLQDTRSNIEDEISEIERERERLPGLKGRKQSLSDELSETNTALESKRQKLAGLRDQSTENAETDDLTDALQDRRRERNRIESSIEQERRSISGLKDQRAEIESEHDSLAVNDDRLATLEERISTLQAQKRDVDETISSLSTLAGLNTEALNGDTDVFVDESSSTDALNPTNQAVACWTCGTSVERQTIETRTAEIQQLAADKRARRDELEEQLLELRNERQEIDRTREQRASLESKRERIETELATRQQRVTELCDEKELLTDRITELESELAKLDDENETDDDKVAVSQTIGELEATVSRLESEHEDVEKRINDISDRTEVLPELNDERDALSEQIRNLRGVVARKEDALVTSFNDRMDDLLERLTYDNVARIWLEKKGGPDEGKKFALNVTREDDVVYEDRVSNLSESEREIVGLMAAVVGYSVHDVGDIFPIIVLDSLEAIDASRVASLIEYLSEETEFLIAALLEEDAQELPDTYTRAAPCSD